MNESTRRLSLVLAVVTGALVLFVPTVGLLLAGAVFLAMEFLGEPPQLVGAALLLVSMVLAVYTAYEIAAIRLHGLAALRRGSRRRVLLRHALLAVPVVAATIVLVGELTLFLFQGVEEGSISLAGLALTIVIGGAAILTINLRSFVRDGSPTP